MLTNIEYACLIKILAKCHYWFMREPGGEERIGYENYIALALLSDRLEGRYQDMPWYDKTIKANALEWMRDYLKRP